MGKLLVANLKMYMNSQENLNFINAFKNDDVIVCPSSVYIPFYLTANFKVGAQNVAQFENGAYTGEVSAKQLNNLNVGYSLVGHSERRSLFNDCVSQKVNQCLENNILPIVCIGETYAQYMKGETEVVLKRQIDEFMSDKDLIIAYEPIWAIGTGKTADNDTIEKTTLFIKKYVLDKYKVNVLVLYGGSVNENNIKKLNDLSIDGYLVGSACTKLDSFRKMIEAVK